MTEQRLSHPDSIALSHVRIPFKPRRSEDDDRGPVTEVPHLIALSERRAAGKPIRSPVFEIQRHVEKLEVDAGDQDGGHGTSAIAWLEF